MTIDAKDPLIRAAVLRAVRAAVRDHAPRDPFAAPLALDCIGETYPDVDYMPDVYTLADVVKDRVWAIRERRAWSDSQRLRTVREALSDAEVLGFAHEFCSSARRLDEIVVRVRYADTWLADYAVSSTLPALCWMD